MTPPPRYQAEAPGTATSAALINPPAADSATARVCRRSLSRWPTALPRALSDCIHSCYQWIQMLTHLRRGGGYHRREASKEPMMRTILPARLAATLLAAALLSLSLPPAQERRERRDADRLR